MYLKKQGFTVAELLIVMIAVAILSLTIGLLMMLPVRALRGNNDIADLKRDMALAMVSITRDVRESQFNDVAANYGAGQLILPASSVRGSIIAYQLQGTALSRTVNGGGATTIIEDGVNGFRSWSTNDTVTGLQGIGLRIRLTSGGGVPLVHDSFIHTRN